ncbi:hypothetical protein [Paludisphaera mucosa]|uniref:Uncharacterized protein n=1 Tax=Paludisphaera mucosa TaxID=3030827 RepID=A0ABT6F4H3_9BACT|nr:hypothetical protein [Paludisphaera mucosa]MDG3002396.1 hypothetical protein [Paludisphaera mucosa]
MGNRKSREHQKQARDRAMWDQARTASRDFVEDVLVPGIGVRRLQVVLVPSFEQGFAWDVRVLGVTWRLFRSEISNEDYSGPKLSGYEELDASGDMLREYFDKLRTLTLPIGPLLNDMGGLDGTDYHLALFGDLQSEVRLRWWTESPPQWSPLVAIADDMIETFLRLRPKDD